MPIIVFIKIIILRRFKLYRSVKARNQIEIVNGRVKLEMNAYISKGILVPVINALIKDVTFAIQLDNNPTKDSPTRRNDLFLCSKYFDMINKPISNPIST